MALCRSITIINLNFFCSSVNITRNYFSVSKTWNHVCVAYQLSIYGTVHVSARIRFLALCSGKIQTQKILIAELAAKSNDLFLAFCYNYFYSITIMLLEVTLCMARNTRWGFQMHQALIWFCSYPLGRVFVVLLTHLLGEGQYCLGDTEVDDGC